MLQTQHNIRFCIEGSIVGKKKGMDVECTTILAIGRSMEEEQSLSFPYPLRRCVMLRDTPRPIVRDLKARFINSSPPSTNDQEHDCT